MDEHGHRADDGGRHYFVEGERHLDLPDLRADPVSRAKPMDATRRRLIYTGQLGMDPALRRQLPLTPRQARRDRHKTRRADARRARLEARRG